MITFPIHILAFFATALACNGELAARRPPTAHLTQFYLWLSLGGVLGGAFNALLAPLLFKTVAEYVLMVVVAIFLRPNFSLWKGSRPWLNLVIPAAVFPWFYVGKLLLGWIDVPFHYREYADLGVVVVAAVAVGLIRARPLGLGLGVLSVIMTGLVFAPAQRTVHQERNFFGVLRVAASEEMNIFFHGKTMHGAQSLDPAQRREPQLYFSRTGPLGEVFTSFSGALQGKRIAVAGLGAGAIAAYGLPGQGMDFYELDPAVERIARDPRYFTYLADSPASVRVVLGDARLKLAEAPPGSYAMIIMDVFSGDSIPVHLLTREALRTYLEKLAPGGVLVFHISNAYLDLQPVMHALAEDAGLTSAIRWGSLQTTPAVWVVMARSITDLVPLSPYPDWFRTVGKPEVGLWTDSFSNIFRVLKFR
jgi:hypothetical protein